MSINNMRRNIAGQIKVKYGLIKSIKHHWEVKINNIVENLRAMV